MRRHPKPIVPRELVEPPFELLIRRPDGSLHHAVVLEDGAEPRTQPIQSLRRAGIRALWPRKPTR